MIQYKKIKGLNHTFYNNTNNYHKLVKVLHFFNLFLCLLVEVVVNIDYRDQMSRNEVISLTYSSPLRLNVRISAYFVQLQV